MLVLPIDGGRGLLVLAPAVPQFKDKANGVVVTDRETGAPLVEVPLALTGDSGQPQVLRVSVPAPSGAQGPRDGSGGQGDRVDAVRGGDQRPAVADVSRFGVDGAEAMNTEGVVERITALVHSGQLRLLPLVVLVPVAVFIRALCRPGRALCVGGSAGAADAAQGVADQGDVEAHRPPGRSGADGTGTAEVLVVDSTHDGD